MEEKAAYERHVGECEACATLAALMGALDSDLRRGTRVGRYEILNRLGAGAMGTVYAANDPALDRKIALKLIRAKVAGPELEERLLREAKAMARLSHPDVIAVYDAGRDGDRLFIAMELVEGGTLREWLAERRRSWREILAVYLHAGRGLAQAHALGLIHRDFKPDNVLVGNDGRVRVTDFGLARSVEHGDEAPPVEVDRIRIAFDRTSPAPLTRTGALVGTPAYMAPEQFAGGAADARSDVYAFCVALYEALYGDRPFGGVTLGEHRAEKVRGALRTSASDRAVPARLRRVLAVGLRPKPEQRYATMEEALAALGRAGRWPLPASWGARTWVLAGSVALAVVSGGEWLATRRLSARAPDRAPDSVAAAVAALASAEGKLACPIFQVRGADDVAVPMGAAAAALACARLAWELGGRSERVLLPAALLDLPREPSDEMQDPYVSAEQRARTIEVGRARAAAYLDGSVVYERNAWTVEIQVKARDGREIVRASAADDSFLHTMRRALDSLWSAPLVRRGPDPDVAQWVGASTADVGLILSDLVLDSTAGCDRLAADAGMSRDTLLYVQKVCEKFGAPVALDGGVPSLDESSPEALVTSLHAVAAWEIPVPVDRERTLAAKLDSLRGSEPSSFGRARLAYTAGLAWTLANDRERAQSSLRLSLRDDPTYDQAWELVEGAAGGGTPLAASTSAVARAWLPYESRLVPKADSWRGDELDARLRDAHLAYLLEPRLVEALHLGRALAEAGRPDDARAVAATPLDDPATGKWLAEDILGLIDLHDAKLARAIPHLEEGGNPSMIDLLVVADVAGRAEEVSTRWARRFLARSDADADMTARGYHAPMFLCMHARGALATECLGARGTTRPARDELVVRRWQRAPRGSEALCARRRSRGRVVVAAPGRLPEPRDRARPPDRCVRGRWRARARCASRRAQARVHLHRRRQRRGAARSEAGARRGRRSASTHAGARGRAGVGGGGRRNPRRGEDARCFRGD